MIKINKELRPFQKPQEVLPSRPFNISVVAATTNLGNDEACYPVAQMEEVNLLRSAILYADQITLCSISAYSALHIKKIQDNEDIIAFLDQMIRMHEAEIKTARKKGFGITDAENELEDVKKTRIEMLRKLKAAPKHERKKIRDEFKNVMTSATLELMQVGYGSLFTKAGLKNAIDSKLIIVDKFGDGDIYDWMSLPSGELERLTEVSYASKITEMIVTGNAYPLLDSEASKIAGLIADTMTVPLPDATHSHAKECALAKNVLDNLPNFQRATFDQLLDIRRELRGPLVRFRKAMIDFSDQIKSASWNNEFVVEADRLFRRSIEPEIEAIESQVRSNSYMRELINNGEQPWRTATGLVAAMSPVPSFLKNFPTDIAHTALSVGGVSLLATALGIYSKVRQKAEIIESNQLYFYPAVKKRLQNITSN